MLKPLSSDLHHLNTPRPFAIIFALGPGNSRVSTENNCKAISEAAVGCCDVSATLDLQTNIDSERELARIHSLTISHMDRLEKVMSACECQAVYTGDICFLPSSVIEDVQSCFKTLNSLREAAFMLEREHRAYLRMVARETKYGSKQAPIGDDNYLLLASRLDSITPLRTLTAKQPMHQC